MTCDFCPAESGVLAYYHAAETRLTFAGPGGVRHVHLSAEWAACPPCSRLIDAGDRAGLLKRARKRFGVRGAVAVASLAAVHRAFFEGRRKAA